METRCDTPERVSNKNQRSLLRWSLSPFRRRSAGTRPNENPWPTESDRGREDQTSILRALRFSPSLCPRRPLWLALSFLPGKRISRRGLRAHRGGRKGVHSALRTALIPGEDQGTSDGRHLLPHPGVRRHVHVHAPGFKSKFISVQVNK